MTSMTQTGPTMNPPTTAATSRVVIAGIDTHKELHVAAVIDTGENVLATHSGTVKLVSGAAEADDLGVDTQPEGPSWARCRTRVAGIRRRSSRTACGCITGSR